MTAWGNAPRNGQRPKKWATPQEMGNAQRPKKWATPKEMGNAPDALPEPCKGEVNPKHTFRRIRYRV